MPCTRRSASSRPPPNQENQGAQFRRRPYSRARATPLDEATNRGASYAEGNTKCETSTNSRNISQKGQKPQLMTESEKFDPGPNRKRQAAASASKTSLLNASAGGPNTKDGPQGVNYNRPLRNNSRSTTNSQYYTDDEQMLPSRAKSNVSNRARSVRESAPNNENVEPDENKIFKVPECSTNMFSANLKQRTSTAQENQNKGQNLNTRKESYVPTHFDNNAANSSQNNSAWYSKLPQPTAASMPKKKLDPETCYFSESEGNTYILRRQTERNFYSKQTGYQSETEGTNGRLMQNARTQVNPNAQIQYTSMYGQPVNLVMSEKANQPTTKMDIEQNLPAKVVYVHKPSADASRYHPAEYNQFKKPEPPLPPTNYTYQREEVRKEPSYSSVQQKKNQFVDQPPINNQAQTKADRNVWSNDIRLLEILSQAKKQPANRSSNDISSPNAQKTHDAGNKEQDEIDIRLNGELESLFATKELPRPAPTPLAKTPTELKTVERAHTRPLNAKKMESEIDARLQAELDSLPMVAADDTNESPKETVYKTHPYISVPTVKYLAEDKVLLKPNPVGISSQSAAPTNSMAKNAMEMGNAGVQLVNNPLAARISIDQQHNLQQGPIVTRLKNSHGQDIAVKYTTGPNGLITNVQMVQPAMGIGQLKVTELESFTASQLHQLLQSGHPYMALPMTYSGFPGAMLQDPLKTKTPIFPPEQAVEDEEVDYEEIGVADTFAAYWPSKLKFGRGHPDAVVETATLSSVELPDITYQLALPSKTTECLSALQLEAVVYACQAHEQILPSGERAGFLLGDGAGVGKGRTIAGIIFDNYVKGRKRALWISVSNDLKFDAERDLADIGAHEKIRVAAISKFKYSRIDSEENENFRRGVIFCTYTALIGESLTANSKYKTRLRQLVHWLGKKFEGVIVFDECHKAKNLSLMNVGKSTKTGTTVLELQKLLPKARVVYASATGASEPRNMAYMVRLGLWGPGTAYPEFYEFVNAVEKRGIGAMEIVAMDMKLRGTYIARQLSFKDVSFRIEEVTMPKEFRKSYNLAAELWAEINKKFQKACRLMCIENRVQKIITCQFWCAHQRFFKNLCIASKVNHVVKMTRQATRMGKAVVIGLQSTGESRTLEHLERHHGKLVTFVSTSKMIIQSFVEKHFPAPKRDSFHHLLNTGEFEPEARCRPSRPKRSKMNPDWFDDDMDAEAGESDIEMYESSWTADEERIKSGRKRRGRPPKADKVEKITMQERILQHLCSNMRAQDNEGEPSYTFDNTKPQKANITERDVERCINMREMLLEKIEILGKRLPPNTLDKLISELGGTNLVAEMTGRRGRVVRSEYDGYKYEPRCENDSSMDLVNYREKQRFMDGSKHVAIISEAASSGISLQSDKRVSNQRRRLHITLELPWSADRAIQQFGRTHRSNQVNSPEYVFVITDLAGERRFASTVAKRLESLGALTQGDRRATDARDLSQFNIDNSIGRSALENVMQLLTSDKPLDQSQVPQSYKGDFLYDCCVAMAGVGMINVREENKVKVFSVEKDSNNISKFLNRILGCRVEVQNALFKFFLDKMYSLIMQMKRTGRFDLGILDLDAHGASVKSIKLMRFIRNHATGTAATELHTVTVERGMSFETALAKYRKEVQHEHEGFYILQQLRQNKNSSILCLQAPSNSSDVSKINLQIYRPNTGPQVRLETHGSISSRYVKVSPEEAQKYWVQQYDLCLNMCSHVYWNRTCPMPTGCEVGLRMRTYHVLSGLMLPIWDRIELIIVKNGHKIQIIRVKTDVNKKIVGTVVPHAVYDALVADLSTDSIVEIH